MTLGKTCRREFFLPASLSWEAFVMSVVMLSNQIIAAD
jgi:hypothetical protein